jgi:hypothetical protein
LSSWAGGSAATAEEWPEAGFLRPPCYGLGLPAILVRGRLPVGALLRWLTGQGCDLPGLLGEFLEGD